MQLGMLWQKIVLNVTHNEKKLITLITEYLVHHVANSFRNELIITPEHRIPIAIKIPKTISKTHRKRPMLSFPISCYFLPAMVQNTCVSSVMTLMCSFFSCTSSVSYGLSVEWQWRALSPEEARLTLRPQHNDTRIYQNTFLGCVP